MTIQGKATLGSLAALAGRWLTVKELAKRLSVHPDTIRRWAKRGRIECIRHPVNNYRLFLLDDFEMKEDE